MKLTCFVCLLGTLIASPGHATGPQNAVEVQQVNRTPKVFSTDVAKGNGEALRRLGFQYYHGEGVVQDNKRAVGLFERAAMAGDIQSASNLGKMYQLGLGVEQDDRRAAFWFLQAADQGDRASQFESSLMYYLGQGVAKDRVEAAKWWTLAMMKSDEYTERIRPTVALAEAKLTATELAAGRRLAVVWSQGR